MTTLFQITMKWKLSFGAAIICLLYALFAGNNYRKERYLYKNQVENDFNSKYLKLEHQLKTSEQQRLALTDSIISINRDNEVIQHHSDSIEIELKRVKGRYRNMSSSDKAKELTRRANGN